MKNRDQKITFRVTNSEKDSIVRQADLCGLSLEKYCRAKLVAKRDDHIKPKPPPEVPKLLTVSSALGYTLNELGEHIDLNDHDIIEKFHTLQAIHIDLRRLIKEM